LQALIHPVEVVTSPLSTSCICAAEPIRSSAPVFDRSFVHGAATAAPQTNSDPAALAAILKKMDAVSASFRTAQAEFEWDNYQKVIDEIVDVQTGTIYYRRDGKEI